MWVCDNSLKCRGIILKPCGDWKAMYHVLASCIRLCVKLLLLLFLFFYFSIKTFKVNKIKRVFDSFQVFISKCLAYQNMLNKLNTVRLQCPLFSPKAPLQCCTIYLSFECLHFHIQAIRKAINIFQSHCDEEMFGAVAERSSCSPAGNGLYTHPHPTHPRRLLQEARCTARNVHSWMTEPSGCPQDDTLSGQH